MYYIEFRDGSYFQSLEAVKGGQIKTAKAFSTKADAEAFMDAHGWIYANGGMAVQHSPLSGEERVRVMHTIARVRASLEALEIALKTETKVDPGETQSIVNSAMDLGFSLSRLYAYQRAEEIK